MSKPFFCSIAAQKANEALIGTAGHYQAYVLIECPLPWPSTAFDSEHIPPALRQYIDAHKVSKTVRFLCIHRGTTQPSEGVTILVYEQINNVNPLVTPKNFTQFASGYRGYEFQLANMDSVVPCLEAYWQDRTLSGKSRQTLRAEASTALGKPITQQDILVCTHGMKDKCCARLGKPIFRGATRMAAKGTLPNTRVWRASHIGGHRFAPTAIVLPEGRYYGRLSLSALKAVVTRKGDIDQLRPIYRGWGMLPKPLQLLEEKLLHSYGWPWFQHSVAYHQLVCNTDEGEISARISVLSPDGEVTDYHARITQDEQQSYSGKASCGDVSPSRIVKYAIADFSIEKTVEQSALPKSNSDRAFSAEAVSAS